MAHETHPPKQTFVQRIKEAWPIITFSAAMAVAVASGYFDMRMAQAENARGVTNNAGVLTGLKDLVENKASKFITDQELQRIWEDIKDQAEDMEDLEAKIGALDINDERVNAKIELEVERLRAEIQRAASEQQRTLDAQATIMQQILQEVRQD